MLRLCAVLLAALALGCGKKDASSSSGSSSSSGPSARHIDGGSAQNWKGVSFDIPKSWTATPKQDVLVLTPEGANASGTLEELYAMTADTAVRSLDGPDTERAVDDAVGKIQPGMSRSGSPSKETFGEVEGRVYLYSGAAGDGKKVEVRIYGYQGNGAVCSLLAFGYSDKVATRDADLKAILASMTKPAAAAGGASDGKHPELFGQWVYMTNVTANNGGSQTNSYVNLNGDGTYKWHWDVVSSNPEGAAWNNENDTGTWSATENSLTLKSQSGQTTTMTLVKRNHPKNTGDPMIVLNGKAYVTASPKAPW